MNNNRNYLNENEKELIKNHVTRRYNSSEEYPAPLTASSFISDQNQNTGAGSTQDEAARTFIEATRTPASAEIRFSEALTAQSAEGRRIAAIIVEEDVEHITALVSSQLPEVDPAAIEREVRNQVTTAYTGTGQYLGGVLVLRGQEDSYDESIENGAELANAVEQQAAEDANSGLEAESGPEGEVDLGFYYPESDDDQNSDSNDSGMGEEVSDSSQYSGSEEEQISDSFEDNGSQEADHGSSDPANDSSDYGSSDSGDSPTSSDYHADESTKGYDSDQNEQCSTNGESVSDGEQSGTGAFSDPKEGSEDKAHVIESDQSNQSTRKRKFDGEEDDYPNPKRQRKSDSDDDNNGKGGPGSGTGSSGGGPSVSGPEDSGPGDSVGGTDNGISNKSLFEDISLFFYGKERDENFLSPVDFVIEIEQEE